MDKIKKRDGMRNCVRRWDSSAPSASRRPVSASHSSCSSEKSPSCSTMHDIISVTRGKQTNPLKSLNISTSGDLQTR